MSDIDREVKRLQARVAELEAILIDLLDENKHILVGGYAVQGERIYRLSRAGGR